MSIFATPSIMFLSFHRILAFSFFATARTFVVTFLYQPVATSHKAAERFVLLQAWPIYSQTSLLFPQC